MVVARTQAERTETTRQALVAAGRELFATKGFKATATEEVVARAGVTRGALYHHFRDKVDLFRAVYSEVEQEMVARVTSAMDSDDVIAAGEAGVRAYLEACREPEFQQICHVDGPHVLGFDEWRIAARSHGVEMIGPSLKRAIDEGLIKDREVDPLAHIIHGALMEAGMYVSAT
ncbi:MAG: TetR/AcrR family transcriptional regulator, partial [Actinomycetota bacterium]